ncbi:MAG TPA: 4Fe-4S binding protein [Elusimicrobiales bacterium]|nr:4Fe-4S binding protein [Elusimicrobiales bacterium]
MADKAYVNPDKCDGMPTCRVKFGCPVGAVSQARGLLGGLAFVDKEKCLGCGKCVALCPHGALSMMGEK